MTFQDFNTPSKADPEATPEATPKQPERKPGMPANAEYVESRTPGGYIIRTRTDYTPHPYATEPKRVTKPSRLVGCEPKSSGYSYGRKD